MKESKQQVTEAELQSAIRKFLDKGGMIHKLPDQKSGTARMVGRKWDSTEVGGELS